MPSTAAAGLYATALPVRAAGVACGRGDRPRHGPDHQRAPAQLPWRGARPLGAPGWLLCDGRAPERPCSTRRGRQLAPPLAEGLFREVSEVGEDWWWTAQPGASATMRDAFALRRYLLLTRCYRRARLLRPAPAAIVDGRARRGLGAAAHVTAFVTRRDDAAGDPTAASAPALVFPKPEDHAMHEARRPTTAAAQPPPHLLTPRPAPGRPALGPSRGRRRCPRPPPPVTRTRS